MDIIFILLIFFAVSTSLILHNRGIKLTLPSANSITKEKKGISLTIDQKQQIFLDNKQVTFQEIQPAIISMLKENPRIQIILGADKQTPYNLVIKTLDEIRLGGCSDIVLEAKKTIEHGTHTQKGS